MSDQAHENNYSQEEREEDAYLNAVDAEEEIEGDEDHPMDDGDISDEEITLQNDSVAYFDIHKDSIFCIAAHPRNRSIVVTGGGDDLAFIWDSTPTDLPVLPTSFESNPQPKEERKSLQPLTKLDGHTDSVNAVTFTRPTGEYIVTAGLDGKLRTWRDTSSKNEGTSWDYLAEVQEVEEINWVAACPVNEDGDEENKNVIALGANDGSVWVYRIDSRDHAEPLAFVQTFFNHTASCTAGAWTPDGKLLATVSEDGSFYVYDVFGVAAAAGVTAAPGTQAVVGLTPEDQRFAVDGGLYSVAVAPSGTFACVGGAEGQIRVIGLPRITSLAQTQTNKPKSTKAKGDKGSSSSTAGTILASLQAQTDGIESLSFSAPPLNLLAAGSVDGSITLFDTLHRFVVRRHIRTAHDSAVVKAEFFQDESAATPANPNRSWLLTSVGIDGVVRRWDARGGTAAPGSGLVKEWRGHLGMMENQEGEQSGGILGFVQTGDRIVTAGDDGIALVFQ